MFGISSQFNFEEVLSRAPDTEVRRNDGTVYIASWFLKNSSEGIGFMLHKFYGDDPSGMIHEHAFESVSFCLDGELREEYIDENGVKQERLIKKGDIIYRDGDFTHALHGYATTLFVTGALMKNVVCYPRGKKENGVSYEEVFTPDGLSFKWGSYD